MNEKDPIQYSAEDIQQYFAGKLEPLQMHAMEKAALNDPFLAEAMEGYETMAATDWQKQLDAAKEKLNTYPTVAKVVTLPQRNNWLKYAAAVILLGGATTFSYWAFIKKEGVSNNEIAQNIPAKTDPPAADTKVTDTLNKKADDAETAATENPAPTAEKDLVTNKENGYKALPKAADSNFIYKPSEPPQGSLAKDDDARSEEVVAESKAAAPVTNAAPAATTSNAADIARNNRQYTNVAQNQAEAEKSLFEKRDMNQANAAQRKKETQQLNRLFSAGVVAPDNTPLPFAKVTVKNEGFGTYADVKGNFRLVSNDSVITVEVKSLGYLPKTFILNSNRVQNKIVLTEDAMAFMDKTTVIKGKTAAGGRAQLRRAAIVRDSVIDAEPEDGWDNYETYVDNNMELPDDLIKKNIHGQVSLSFDVKPNGSVTNIKVDKSLCGNCDELAKRLIEQGPQWKVKNGKKRKGKVTVQF
jgi:CarboxypepD_reg-like domain/Gram-negative bacterial TonB protein C-terminal